jgi:hypothetical protein
LNPALLTLLLLGQLQPGDLQYEAQKKITNRQSNANESRLQAQINLHTAQVRLEALRALPGAPTTVTVPITGKTTDAQGNSVTVSGTLTLTIELAGPIPPPVTETKLTGVRNPATGLLVTTTTAGTRLYSAERDTRHPDREQLRSGHRAPDAR